jgi:hypothetical protein
MTEQDRAERQAAIVAAVTAAVAPFKARVEALGRPEAPDPAREAQQQVAIEQFARAYAEGRLGADNETVQ